MKNVKNKRNMFYRRKTLNNTTIKQQNKTKQTHIFYQKKNKNKQNQNKTNRNNNRNKNNKTIKTNNKKKTTHERKQ